MLADLDRAVLWPDVLDDVASHDNRRLEIEGHAGLKNDIHVFFGRRPHAQALAAHLAAVQKNPPRRLSSNIFGHCGITGHQLSSSSFPRSYRGDDVKKKFNGSVHRGLVISESRCCRTAKK